jgi:hypothetical protein
VIIKENFEYNYEEAIKVFKDKGITRIVTKGVIDECGVSFK